MVEGRARGFPGIAPAPAILAKTPAHLIFARDGAGRIVGDLESAKAEERAVLLPLHDPEGKTSLLLPSHQAIGDLAQVLAAFHPTEPAHHGRCISVDVKGLRVAFAPVTAKQPFRFNHAVRRRAGALIPSSLRSAAGCWHNRDRKSTRLNSSH